MCVCVCVCVCVYTCVYMQVHVCEYEGIFEITFICCVPCLPVQSVTALALAEKDRGSAEGGGSWNQQCQQSSQVHIFLSLAPHIHLSWAPIFDKRQKQKEER